MTYEQQRAQFRLELGAASRAEASITKEGKKYRGKISDISELGAAFRLRRGVPIEKGDCIDHVEFNLTSEIKIQPKIEIMNVLDVAKAPNLQQFGVRFLGISTADSAALKEFMREEERGDYEWATVAGATALGPAALLSPQSRNPKQQKYRITLSRLPDLARIAQRLRLVLKNVTEFFESSHTQHGEVSERLKEHAWKACIR